ncbi:MAG: hypothetical protein ACTSPW_19285 [Promethearchaeota archaeon]
MIKTVNKNMFIQPWIIIGMILVDCISIILIIYILFNDWYKRKKNFNINKDWMKRLIEEN